MSLIANMGEQYFREWFIGALMVYEGRPVSIADLSSTHVRCIRLDVARGSHDSVVEIEHDYFTGFKVLQYPPLGYRRVDNIIYHVHRSQSAYRGLRANLLTFEQSPLSYMLQASERTAGQLTAITGNQRLSQVMCPTFDTRASLDALVQGRQVGVVPSEDVCIEPSINGDEYVVLYRGKAVGTMDNQKNFTIANAAVRAAVQNAFQE